jgi:hypothetical protein
MNLSESAFFRQGFFFCADIFHWSHSILVKWIGGGFSWKRPKWQEREVARKEQKYQIGHQTKPIP